MLVNWLLKKLHARANVLTAKKNTKKANSPAFSALQEMAQTRRSSAIKLIDEGRFGEAEIEYMFLIDNRLNDNNDFVSLGFVLKAQNKLHEARQVLERVVAHQESRSEVEYMLASIYRSQSLADLASTAFENALKIDPQLRPAYLEYCSLLIEQEKFEVATKVLLAGMKIFPTEIEFHTLFGSICFLQKKYGDARSSYQFATSLDSSALEPLWGLFASTRVLREYEAAMNCLDSLEKLLKDNSRVYHERGKLLLAMKRPLEALKYLDIAENLAPENIDLLNDKGCALLVLSELESAYELFMRVIDVIPESALAHLNAGVTEWRFRNHKHAIDLMEKAESLMLAQLCEKQREFVHSMSISEIATGPELEFYFASRYPLGICYLTMGELEKGFKGYEWRWRDEQFRQYKRTFTCKLWVGDEPLVGKSILLYAEQGLGDTLQFVRYVRMVKDLGARVYLEVPHALKRILERDTGADELIIYGDSLPKTDFYCPLLTLPLAFRTTLNTIPKSDSYIKINEIAPNLVAAWGKKLFPNVTKRVGVVWSGNTNHTADKYRSIPFEKFSKIFIAEIEFYSLQKDLRLTDQEAFSKCKHIIDFSAEFSDFVDTAAFISQLDLVIAVDTSVAHLAAAMGKPVWILLPYTPDWRWLFDRKDSPWYPSVALFRQSTHDNWDQVLDEVSARLKELL